MKKEEEDSTPVLVAKSPSYHSSDSSCAWRICDNNAMMKLVVFSLIFSYHSFSSNQMFGEKANKLSLYVCTRIYTNRCRRAYMHVSCRFLSALLAQGLWHDNADVTEDHDTTRVCGQLLLRWNPLSILYPAHSTHMNQYHLLSCAWRCVSVTV